MKKLGKLKLNQFNEMNDSEMKNIVGGYDEAVEPAHCARKACLTNKDCGTSYCTSWSDCKKLKDYGQSRCL